MKKYNETLAWTSQQREWERWTGSNRCPECGCDEIEYNTIFILTSNPPQSQLRCKRCGHHFSSGFEHDQSILNVPRVGDWPLAPFHDDQPSYPDVYPLDKNSKIGWICPKCGRALAPHLDSCPYCSGLTTINITCKGE